MVITIFFHHIVEAVMPPVALFRMQSASPANIPQPIQSHYTYNTLKQMCTFGVKYVPVDLGRQHVGIIWADIVVEDQPSRRATDRHMKKALAERSPLCSNQHVCTEA
jgi:hypothetical protein